MISDAQMEAAARVLFAHGVHQGWWRTPKTYEELDPMEDRVRPNSLAGASRGGIGNDR